MGAMNFRAFKGKRGGKGVSENNSHWRGRKKAWRSDGKKGGALI